MFQFLQDDIPDLSGEVILIEKRIIPNNISVLGLGVGIFWRSHFHRNSSNYFCIQKTMLSSGGGGLFFKHFFQKRVRLKKKKKKVFLANRKSVLCIKDRRTTKKLSQHKWVADILPLPNPHSNLCYFCQPLLSEIWTKHSRLNWTFKFTIYMSLKLGRMSLLIRTPSHPTEII